MYTGVEHRHGVGGQQRTAPARAGRVFVRAALLQGARGAGAERTVLDEAGRRRHPVDHHRTGHLEESRQAVHAKGSLPGEK